MAAKKLFTQIFIYFSKPLRLLYSLIIYEIVNFSFFTLYSLLLLSFFLYLKSVPIYVIVHVHVHVHVQCTCIKGTGHGSQYNYGVIATKFTCSTAGSKLTAHTRLKYAEARVLPRIDTVYYAIAIDSCRALKTSR